MFATCLLCSRMLIQTQNHSHADTICTTHKVGKLRFDDSKDKSNIQMATLNPEFFRVFEFQVTMPGESQLKLKVRSLVYRTRSGQRGVCGTVKLTKISKVLTVSLLFRGYGSGSHQRKEGNTRSVPRNLLLFAESSINAGVPLSGMISMARRV